MENQMDNQEIFELLSEAESKLFYAAIRNKTNKELQAAHKSAKELLESFAKSTGCHN